MNALIYPSGRIVLDSDTDALYRAFGGDALYAGGFSLGMAIWCRAGQITDENAAASALLGVPIYGVVMIGGVDGGPLAQQAVLRLLSLQGVAA